MKIAITILFQILFIVSSIIAADVHVSRAQIIEALHSDSMNALLRDVKSMDRQSQNKVASDIVGLIQENLASRPTNGEPWNSDAIVLMNVLPEVADDPNLAASLRPYAEGNNEELRRAAIDALSRGRGPAAGQVLVEQGAASFARMPSLPFKPRDESEARDVSNQGIVFVLCLKGLLGSDSEQIRGVGAKYLDMYRTRYSGTAEGRAGIQAIERELERSGIGMSKNGTMPETLSAEADKHTRINVPLTPRATPSSTAQASPAKAERPMQEEAGSNLIWLYSLAAIILGGIGFVFYRSRKR